MNERSAHMFELDSDTLKKQGAYITTSEIKQQPQLWEEVIEAYSQRKQQIEEFLESIAKEINRRVRVIFTGAGTSQYVGDTIIPHLLQYGDTTNYSFESIGTTSIVSNPRNYLLPDEPTILVSFARSGNSPESVAAVQLANQFVKNIFHITITCAPDGMLAKNAEGDKRNLLLLMPEKSNDKGFAMTGSFSCMTLTGLLVFDRSDLETKKQIVASMSKLGENILSREHEINAYLSKDVDRIVYLGSGSLSGLAREAQLKVLELTAGRISTAYDSSMGFRHGPKSFLNERTVVFGFVSNDHYTSQYDVDVLNEIAMDRIVHHVVGIGQRLPDNLEAERFMLLEGESVLPDGYAAIVDVVFAQTIALLASILVGNTPDTPSPTGTVNRVVKGVRIYEA